MSLFFCLELYSQAQGDGAVCDNARGGVPDVLHEREETEVQGNTISEKKVIRRLLGTPTPSRSTFQTDSLHSDTLFGLHVEQVTGFSDKIEDTELYAQYVAWQRVQHPRFYAKMRQRNLPPMLCKDGKGIPLKLQGDIYGKPLQDTFEGRRHDGAELTLCVNADDTFMSPCDTLYFALYHGSQGVCVCLVSETSVQEPFGDEINGDDAFKVLRVYYESLPEHDDGPLDAREDFWVRLYALSRVNLRSKQ